MRHDWINLSPGSTAGVRCATNITMPPKPPQPRFHCPSSHTQTNGRSHQIRVRSGVTASEKSQHQIASAPSEFLHPVESSQERRTRPRLIRLRSLQNAQQHSARPRRGRALPTTVPCPPSTPRCAPATWTQTRCCRGPLGLHLPGSHPPTFPSSFPLFPRQPDHHRQYHHFGLHSTQIDSDEPKEKTLRVASGECTGRKCWPKESGFPTRPLLRRLRGLVATHSCGSCSKPAAPSSTRRCSAG